MKKLNKVKTTDPLEALADTNLDGSANLAGAAVNPELAKFYLNQFIYNLNYNEDTGLHEASSANNPYIIGIGTTAREAVQNLREQLGN